MRHGHQGCQVEKKGGQVEKRRPGKKWQKKGR